MFFEHLYGEGDPYFGNILEIFPYVVEASEKDIKKIYTYHSLFLFKESYHTDFFWQRSKANEQIFC